jgi:probable HAF family extracellular repeat protein
MFAQTLEAATYTYITLKHPKSQGGETVPSGINDNGQVVGYYTNAGGSSYGFVYDINSNSYTT